MTPNKNWMLLPIRNTRMAIRNSPVTNGVLVPSLIIWDAVDYAVRLIGIDHVGLSGDFNYGGGVTGFNSVAEAPNVTRDGYSEEEIRKLWVKTFFVYSERWRTFRGCSSKN